MTVDTEPTVVPKTTVRAAGVRRPDIQGLRALAVLLVFAHHLFAGPTGGFVGVDIFFVISGYLITGLLMREVESTGTISMREFYARRVRRIAPIAAIVLLVTTVFARQSFSPMRAAQTQADSLWALFFGANFHFADIGTDYFELNRPQSAVQHFWSLSVEEQFYVVWPSLLFVAVLIARRAGASTARIVGPLAFLASSLSLVWCIYLTSTDPIEAYFSTPVRAWELGFGALLAVGQGRISRLPEQFRAVASWLGLAGVVLAALTFTATTAFPGYAALLPVVSAGLILAAADPRGGVGSVGILNNRVAQYVGDISYSLYLWHFPVIIFATAYFVDSGATFYLVAGIGPVLLSAASYQFVENPIRHSRWLSKKNAHHVRRSPGGWFADNRRSLAGVSVALVVLAGTAVFVSLQSSKNVEESVPLAATGNIAAIQPTPVTESLLSTSWGSLTPSPDDVVSSVVPQWRPDSCLNTDDSNVGRCVYGDPNGSRTVAVVGDSIAASWMPGIVKALSGWRIQMLTRGQCPMVDIPLKDDSGKPDTACSEHNSWVLQQLSTIQPDMVISSGEAHHFVNRIADGSADFKQNSVTWMEATEKTLRDLKTAADAPVFLLGSPPGGENIQECYTPQSSPAACVRAVRGAWLTTSANENAAAAEAGAVYINPLPWLCSEGWCPATIDHIITYWDGVHFTQPMSEYLAPQLTAALT